MPPPMPNIPVNFIPGRRCVVGGLLWWIPPEDGWVKVREVTLTDDGLILALTWLVVPTGQQWGRQYHLRGLLKPLDGGQGGWYLLPPEQTAPPAPEPPPPRSWRSWGRDPSASSTRDPSPPEAVDRLGVALRHVPARVVQVRTAPANIVRRPAPERGL